MCTFRKTALAAIISGHLMMGVGLTSAQTPPPAPSAEDDAVQLEEMVVSGEIEYRDRTESTAPELVYDQEFFAKFEPVSVGDQLRRVPGVAFTSDIGESDAPQLRGLGQGFTQVLVNGRPIPGAGNDRTVFVDRIPAEIIDRMMLPMIVEAAHMLDEKVVATPAELDTAMCLGLGFPAYLGGPLQLADWMGLQRVVTRCDELRHLGPLYAATDSMRTKAAAGEPYHKNRE